jgi:hypothetical protein
MQLHEVSVGSDRTEYGEAWDALVGGNRSDEGGDLLDMRITDGRVCR